MRERVGKEEGKADIMRQMFWVAGARLHCALTGTIQKACWSFPPEQEAGVFFFSSVPHRLKVTWGWGPTLCPLLLGSFITGKASVLA